MKSLFNCLRCNEPIYYRHDGYHCPNCGYNSLTGESTESQDIIATNNTSSSCIEKTLRSNFDLENNEINLCPSGSYLIGENLAYVPPQGPTRTLRWTGRIDSAPNLLLTAFYGKYDFNIQGSFLYIFDHSQGGQIIEECWSPEIFGQILRNYIDQVDYENSTTTITVTGSKK